MKREEMLDARLVCWALAELFATEQLEDARARNLVEDVVIRCMKLLDIEVPARTTADARVKPLIDWCEKVDATTRSQRAS